MKDRSMIRSTVVTEKSAIAIKQNKYVFYVDPTVNKIQIADAVEKKYGVKVLGVNVNNVKGKVKSRGRLVGKTPDRRKAWVTVATGHEIVEVKELF
jgi:large subunit ribosomal protein L23